MPKVCTICQLTCADNMFRTNKQTCINKRPYVESRCNMCIKQLSVLNRSKPKKATPLYEEAIEYFKKISKLPNAHLPLAARRALEQEMYL